MTTSMSWVDISLEVFDRTQYRGPSITPEMAASARRSFNLVFSRWSNFGVNLWRVSEPISVPLVQNQATYDVAASVISILPEIYVRQYTMLDATTLDPDVLETNAANTSLIINQEGHGAGVGQFVGFPVPISIGGIIVQGFYTVTTVNNADRFRVTLVTAATSTSTNGVVPLFNTFSESSSVQVTLPDHGLFSGNSFSVQVPTTVGGITLNGTYVVTGVVDEDTFLMDVGMYATSNDNEYENEGYGQMQLANLSAPPIDRVLAPLSRADYASIPNKLQTGVPTSYWFNKQMNPTLTVWPLANPQAAYELQYYALQQIEDASGFGTETPNVPYRALEALTAAVTAHFAMKWRPEMFASLSTYAQQVWDEFSDADREKVPFYFVPQFAGY